MEGSQFFISILPCRDAFYLSEKMEENDKHLNQKK